MENEMNVKFVANTIMQQLIGLTSKEVFWSWGIRKTAYAMYNNCPSLYLNVSGLMHKGWVVISLNDSDTYDITLANNTLNTIIEVVTDVYFDELSQTIDSLIERDSKIDDDEYYKRAMADSEYKIENNI